MRRSFVSRNGLFIAAGGLVVLAAVSGSGGLLLGADLRDVLVNLGTEFLSIAITVLVIDALVGARDRQELKERLIRQMGGSDNGLTHQAVRELRAHGWLTDGSLQQEADLRFANLQEADLQLANLQEVVLWGANLQGAFLFNANLREAILREANLQGAVLFNANLQGADLEDVAFNEGTLLPDRTTWTSDTNMAKFTDPDHPEFWRSDNPNSPAYRGDDDQDNDAKGG